MADPYIVRYSIYKYNTGSGRCGETKHSESFDNERDAARFCRKLLRFFGGHDSEEMYDFIGNHGVDDGYILSVYKPYYFNGTKEFVIE